MRQIFGQEEKSESRRNEYTDNHLPIPGHQLTNEEKFVSNNEDLQKRKIMTQQKDLEKLLLKANREDISKYDDLWSFAVGFRVSSTDASVTCLLQNSADSYIVIIIVHNR